MSIKVIRKKERSNSQWTQLEVYIDGDKVASIYGSDSTEVPLTGDSGELKVKYILSKSVKKQVSNGDVVEVSSSPSVKYAFYLMPVLLLLIFTSTAFDLLNFWILGAIVAAYSTFILSVKPLQIKNMTEEAEEPDEIQNEKTA